MENKDKVQRVLGLYSKLQNGQLINKAVEAARYNVNERSIQRDIDDIRAFLEINTDITGMANTIIYDRVKKGYKLERFNNIKLNNSEILAICKILLDSRAFTKSKMDTVIKKVVDCCVPESNKKIVNDLIRNEAFHYIEPRHKSEFIDIMWEIGQAIRQNRFITIDYFRTKDKHVVTRKVKPLAIMFSEYYFYLTAFIADEETKQDFDVINDSFPTIYRVDRIKELAVLDERFHIPYRDRFEEGEFRKRIQFMYGGELQKIKFKYLGPDVDSVLDRLPTAQIISEDEGAFIIEAEVFGKGIEMWIRSQGDFIEIV